MTRLVEFQTLYKWLQRDRRVPWDFALLAEKRGVSEPRSRCFLVYALAPEGMTASGGERPAEPLHRRAGRAAQIVTHDHFIGTPHGGFAVFEVATDEEQAKLADPGPLEGWEITSRPLTFSLTAVGFVAQADFTLRNYGGTSLAELEAAEKPRKRFWWQKPRAPPGLGRARNGHDDARWDSQSA